jgi:hypothetical protein
MHGGADLSARIPADTSYSAAAVGNALGLGTTMRLSENIHNRMGSSLESIVPTVFTWTFAGHIVYVTGDWNAWRDKIPLARSGNEHSAVLSLPIGTYQFKFIVDGNWKHSSTLPTETDQHGNLNNVVIVSPHLPEYDSNAPPGGEGGPPSPIESYDFSMPQHEDYTVEPMALPPLFKAAPVDPKMVADGERVNPSAYVAINHLYDAAADFAADPIMTMATVIRYKSNRFVTTVMVSNTAVAPPRSQPVAIPQQVELYHEQQSTNYSHLQSHLRRDLLTQSHQLHPSAPSTSRSYRHRHPGSYFSRRATIAHALIRGHCVSY